MWNFYNTFVDYCIKKKSLTHIIYEFYDNNNSVKIKIIKNEQLIDIKINTDKPILNMSVLCYNIIK